MIIDDIINSKDKMLALAEEASKDSDNFKNFKKRISGYSNYYTAIYEDKIIAMAGMFQSKYWNPKLVRVLDRCYYFKEARSGTLSWINEKNPNIASTYFLPKQTRLALDKGLIPFYSIWGKKRRPALEKIVIPYGVKNELFLKKNKAPKPISIFTSNPMRGLDWLLQQWEKNIFFHVPGARLNLFTGFETYGKFGLKHKNSVNKILSLVKNAKKNAVYLSPPISRNELKKQISKSRVLLYRGTNDETFCMAVAEAQVLGVPAVVCNFGSLKERIKNNHTGYVCENDEDFSLKTIKLLKDDKTWMRMHKSLIKNNNHENWMEVAKRWQKIID